MYSCGVKYYRCFISELNIFEAYHDEAITEIEKDNSISPTEKETIIKARIGQGQFRKQLLEKYDSACIVTGIDFPELLIASHIKPWSASDNYERVNCENGLLLSANIDKLFDKGLITFNDSGNIIISSILSKENQLRLHIDKSTTAKLKTSTDLLHNLEYHRDILFVK